MAQIQEGIFAVMSVNEEDIDLISPDGMGFFSVETEHRFYDEEIEEEIKELMSGNILHVQVQSEDILQPNSIWMFLEFEVIGHDLGWAWP